MRLTGLITAFMAAGMASAAPMRVIVLSEPLPAAAVHGHSNGEVNANIVPIPMPGAGRRGRPCSSKMSLTNALRTALGLEVVQDFKPHHGHHVAGTAVTFDPVTMEGHTKGGDRIKIVSPPPASQRHRDSPILRLHNALLMLGPWEGRAVAFVFGCGIGVLLRIVFMALLLSYRAITRTRSEEEHVRTGEDYVIPAPDYYLDEKDPILFEVVEIEEEEQRK
ncbi:hypothetical protein CYLTODRAFT_443608 [Cylindrobasidium torrendii FP15055 ss-10]|uniref:Uncharacterized protein n=1 Tax=Cylindrobasidium torrendii FP15055 ss-10 TaxID=1314674 RepID=A0A0D7BCP1_9AGAR|nr:hypothetical protein CYLTODRAFT_443608 [Cylindrobasidium torrendii FP15055 ss-10]